MGEETYKPGMRVGDEPTFIVDPIDGTTYHPSIHQILETSCTHKF